MQLRRTRQVDAGRARCRASAMRIRSGARLAREPNLVRTTGTGLGRQHWAEAGELWRFTTTENVGDCSRKRDEHGQPLV